MKRMVVVLFLAAGLLAGCAHTSGSTDELAHKAEDAEEKRERCVRIAITGSRLKKKVCRTLGDAHLNVKNLHPEAVQAAQRSSTQSGGGG